MRVNKFLANIGQGSRREIDEAINQGLVSINGELAHLGQKLSDGDLVQHKDQEFRYFADSIKEIEKTYIAFNKPSGIECTCNPKIENNIIDFLNIKDKRIYPIGRLDKNSRGLILLTNDGELCQKLSHPKYEHEKEYLVTCSKEIDADFIDSFCKGVKIEIDDGEIVKTKPCHAEKLNENQFKCTLTQGYKRQIREMVKALGNEVKDLLRIRIAKLKLDELGISEGQHIELQYSQCL